MNSSARLAFLAAVSFAPLVLSAANLGTGSIPTNELNFSPAFGGHSPDLTLTRQSLPKVTVGTISAAPTPRGAVRPLSLSLNPGGLGAGTGTWTFVRNQPDPGKTTAAEIDELREKIATLEIQRKILEANIDAARTRKAALEAREREAKAAGNR